MSRLMMFGFHNKKRSALLSRIRLMKLNPSEFLILNIIDRQRTEKFAYKKKSYNSKTVMLSKIDRKSLCLLLSAL